jgi:fructoselysine 6-kinase
VSSTDRRIGLAAVGDNCVDILQPSGRRFVGGNAVNVAVQFAVLGGSSAYLGAVGEDDDGALTARLLARNGVDISHLVRRPLPTAHTEIHVSQTGERRIGFEDFGACAGYAPDENAVAAALAADHVHIGWFDDGGALRRRLAAAGRSVSQDITVNASAENLGVEGLAIAFASIDGPHEAAARLAGRLFGAGARGVVVTRGARGSSLFLDGTETEIPARPIVAVDTTGAGDSYIAAFLHGWLSGATPQAAGTRAAAHAALTCMHEGGFRQAPADA